MRILVIMAAMLAATEMSYASKARVSALQNAIWLSDSQTQFNNVSDMNSLGQYVTFEMGNNTSTAPKAEGGVFFKSGDYNHGLYLGHLSPYQTAYRGSDFLNQENPIDLF